MARQPMVRPDPSEFRPADEPPPTDSPAGGAQTALSFAVLLQQIVDQARLATAATASAIALRRGDEIVCSATSGPNTPDLGVSLNTSSGLSGACVRTGQMQYCADTETDPRVNAAACRVLQIRSVLIVPLISEARMGGPGPELLGVFELFSPLPNAFEDHDLRTLEGLAQWIVDYIQNAKTSPAQTSAAQTTPASPSPVANAPQPPPDEPLFDSDEPLFARTLNARTADTRTVGDRPSDVSVSRSETSAQSQISTLPAAPHSHPPLKLSAVNVVESEPENVRVVLQSPAQSEPWSGFPPVDVEVVADPFRPPARVTAAPVESSVAQPELSSLWAGFPLAETSAHAPEPEQALAPPHVLDSAPVSKPQAKPKTAARPSKAEFPPPLPDLIPIEPASLPEPEKNESPRDWTTSFLIVILIVLALLLGWMLGRVGWETALRSSISHNESASSPNAQAHSNASTDSQGADPSAPVASPAPDEPSNSLPSRTPFQPKNGDARPNGGLAVYESGKLIFRQSPPDSKSVHSITDATKEISGQENNSKGSKAASTVPELMSPEFTGAHLIKRVEPVYPEHARQLHIQGPVVLEALISKKGSIQELHLINGDTELATAAAEAIRQWRFKPYVSNGKAADFRTRLTINFTLR